MSPHLVVAVALTCAACTNDPGPPPPVMLQARAGDDRTVPTGLSVFLDGSHSVSRYTVTYLWRIVSAPEGSRAALDDETSAKPRLVPDRDGRYVVELVISTRGVDSEPDTVTVTAFNLPPGIGPDQNPTQVYTGEVVALAAIAADSNGDPVSLLWKLYERPGESVAVLDDAHSTHASFVADVTGTYRISITADDGKAQTTRALVITAEPPITELPGEVIDAERSEVLDAVVTVSRDPDLLTVYRADGVVARQVELLLPPTALAIAPDGFTAAVGHDGALSLVQLDTGTVTRMLHVAANVGDVVLPGDGVAHVVQPFYGESFLSLRLADGTSTRTFVFGTLILGDALRLHPARDRLYAIVEPSGILRLDVLSGLPIAADTSYRAGDPPCERLWISGDGTRLFSDCGPVLRIDPDVADDLAVEAALEPGGRLEHVDQPLGSPWTIAVPEAMAAGDVSFRVHAADSLAVVRTVPGRTIRVGKAWLPSVTRYAFLSTSRRTVSTILQARAGQTLLPAFALMVHEL